MSEFSDLLSLFIKTRDVNVSALTNYCDLDRSTMYKMINGKRTPSSKEIVKKISSFMNLTPIEAHEFMEAYQLTKLGWHTYYRRKSVLDFILDFETKSNSSYTLPRNFSDFSLFFHNTDKETFPLTGQLQLSSVICKIFLDEITKEKGNICIIAQPEHLEAFNTAALLSNYKTKLSFQHILCINNNKSLIKSQHNYNIQCLKHMVPYYKAFCDYQPYYYYDNVNSHFNNLNFLPCLFLTGNAAVLCSSDLKEGILLRNPEVIKLLQKRFQDILSKVNPLTLKFGSSIQLHLKHFTMASSEPSKIYNLSAEPCLVPSMTPSLLDKYVSKELPERESFLIAMKDYIKSFAGLKLHFYFTKDGVQNFLMTGRLHEIPEDIYSPFEPEDRIALLKRFCRQIGVSLNCHLLKGPLEKFPLELHFSITTNYGYLMFSDQNQDLSYIILKEQNILTAFYDFANSLEENDMLETQEDTIKFLNNMIEAVTPPQKNHLYQLMFPVPNHSFIQQMENIFDRTSKKDNKKILKICAV